MGWEDVDSPTFSNHGILQATHSNIIAWRIPRTEEPDRLQSTGSQRVRNDCRYLACIACIHMINYIYFAGKFDKCKPWCKDYLNQDKNRKLPQASLQTILLSPLALVTINLIATTTD